MKKDLYRFLLLVTLAFASICVFTDCKKDKDDEETLPSLTGTVEFDLDKYVKPGQLVSLTPRGGVHPEGDGIGYVWSFEWKSAKDTTKFDTDPASVTGAIDVIFPDQTGTFNITLYGYSIGYYSLTSSTTVNVVDDRLNASLSNTGIRATNSKFVDSRDNLTYYTKEIGDLVWMRNNLAYSESGVPYSNSPAMSYISGNYYTWEEAKTACPEGWRLPTENDWLSLAAEIVPDQNVTSESPWKGAAGSLMVDAYFHGSKMWEYWPEVKITNETGFSAIPAGYAQDGDKIKFTGVYNYAAFWSADEYNSDNAIYRYINVKSPDVYVSNADKQTFRASVRCVRDAK